MPPVSQPPQRPDTWDQALSKKIGDWSTSAQWGVIEIRAIFGDQQPLASWIDRSDGVNLYVVFPGLLFEIHGGRDAVERDPLSENVSESRVKMTRITGEANFTMTTTRTRVAERDRVVIDWEFRLYGGADPLKIVTEGLLGEKTPEPVPFARALAEQIAKANV